MPLPVCDDDPVDFRYEGESDGAEARVTKQEGGSHWYCSQIPGSDLLLIMSGAVVGLVYVSIQHRGLAKKKGILQMIRMSLSCLSYVGLVSLMPGKAVQEETNLHAKARSEGGGKALTCHGEHQSTVWPKA